MWVGSMILEYVNYILWGPQTKYYIQAYTWKIGWSYIPGTIHRNHCSSQHYSHEIFFNKNIFHSNIVIENTNSIHNIVIYIIYIGTIHYSYWGQFLPIS